jgi:alpha-N-arabinofuranosidase
MPIFQGALRLTAALGLVSLNFVSPGAFAAEAVTATVTIHADKPGPQISKHIYGQFAEHLGFGIYEGIWVGEDSKIPNTRGYRNDVVAALKKLKVPVVRWPGGCFADEYHWREGIGPRDKRPVKVNTHWGYVEEPNTVGTHEFLDFAELIGAAPYVSGNVGSASPQEMADWVEYMMSDTNSTLVQERRKNGRDKPWKVPFFGIGNETWGCGGNMRPEFFADLYRQYQTFVKAPGHNTPLKIASGANSDDYNWTEVMMKQAAKYMDAYSVHYYTIPTGVWKKKGNSVGFTEDEWAATLKRGLFVDELITKHSAIMDKYDPDNKVALYFDEWGTWYDPEPGRNPGFLFQQNTLRDAQVAALSLNVFHRHAKRVKMANIAQMVNVLQAMILTDKEKMTVTPTYHVFEMYIPFQDSTYLPVDVKAPNYQRGDASVPAVDVSAARDTAGKIQVSFVNTDPNRAATVSTKIVGANARSAVGRILTAKTMDAHNTVDKPDVVKPAPFKATRKGDELRVELPPKSIVVVAVE